jgi:hypothetical protein
MKKPQQLHDVILDHALQSESNFRMAVQVGLAFPDIHARIIKEFLAALKADLKKRLGRQWEVSDNWNPIPSKTKLIVSVRKTQWSGEDCIGLACQKRGPSELNWYIYVHPKATPVQQSDIKSALDSKYALGRRETPFNPWWKYIEHRTYRAWNTEESLVALWQKSDAVEYYADHLTRIAKIASPIIDRIRKT